MHQAILSLSWSSLFLVALPSLSRLVFPKAQRYTLENKYLRGLKLELSSALPRCLSFASASFLSVSSVWIHIIFHHPSLSTFILPSFLFYPPWGVEVMPLKTNIPELHLLLISLKEKKKKPLNNNVRSSAVWGTRELTAKKEKVMKRRKDGLDWGNKKNMREAGRQIRKHTVRILNHLFYEANLFTHFPSRAGVSVCVCAWTKSVCVCM